MNPLFWSCNSCNTLFDKPKGEGKYFYCPTCEQERKNPNAKPKVVEYVGGVLGSLPNARNIEHYLNHRNFSRTEVGAISAFIREDDGTPNGNIAILTSDGVLVVVNGKQELLDLLTAYDAFRCNPSYLNLPLQIKASHPEHYPIARSAFEAPRAQLN